MNEQKIIDTVEHVSDVTTEAIVDAVPEFVETVEVVRNNPYILAGVGLVAMTTGVALGYKVAEKRLSTKFDALLEEEIAKTKEHYDLLSKRGDFETPEAAVEKLIESDEEKELVSTYAGKKIRVVEGENGSKIEEVTETENHDGDEIEVTKTTRRNIFVNNVEIDEEFDYEKELAQRGETDPYVISAEEFLENETDFTQINLTYYAGDDVLSDEEDRTVDNKSVVGENNLQKFGHGSKDRNVVYIRNPRFKTEYEVVRSQGKFAVEVLGFNEKDVKPTTRKFRGDDD